MWSQLLGNRPHKPFKSKFKDNDYDPDANHAPVITCQSYVVMEPKRQLALFFKNHDQVREMASLTKMMTCLVSIGLAQRLNLDIKQHWFRVSKIAAKT